jgi:Zn-dependent alcohol dehydrogenase
MRAAVLTEINKPLQILDLEQEPPKANEVRVQVKAAGVCMSKSVGAMCVQRIRVAAIAAASFPASPCETVTLMSSSPC